jgi:hypothetical protein
VKLAASSPEERRRQFMLLGLLAVVAVVVLYMQFGGATTENAAVTSNTPVTAPQPTATQSGRGTAGGGLPEPVRLAALEPVPEQTQGIRNPFGFGAAPPQPRPATPPPPPPPPPTPQVPRPAPAPVIPPIPVKFLGFAEDPAHPGKIVSLGVADGVVLAREGDLVDGRYRLLKIGAESIVMSYADGRGQQTIRLTGE